MPTRAEPILRNWYKDLETGLSFRVVAIDETSRSIDLQYFDGDIGETDFETWYASAFEPIEAPEDWSAPYGDMDRDDLGYTDPDTHAPKIDDQSLSDLLDKKDY